MAVSAIASGGTDYRDMVRVSARSANAGELVLTVVGIWKPLLVNN
jgi:hypothetical protein